jgi:hypothetical protein
MLLWKKANMGAIVNSASSIIVYWEWSYVDRNAIKLNVISVYIRTMMECIRVRGIG